LHMNGTKMDEQIREVFSVSLPKAGFSLKEFILDIEYALILKALDYCDGSSVRAARLLGINRTTLVEKRRRFGLLISRKT
jgi:sigma-54 specific flagellar transcriptional regulator A